MKHSFYPALNKSSIVYPQGTNYIMNNEEETENKYFGSPNIGIRIKRKKSVRNCESPRKPLTTRIVFTHPTLDMSR